MQARSDSPLYTVWSWQCRSYTENLFAIEDRAWEQHGPNKEAIRYDWEYDKGWKNPILCQPLLHQQYYILYRRKQSWKELLVRI